MCNAKIAQLPQSMSYGAWKLSEPFQGETGHALRRSGAWASSDRQRLQVNVLGTTPHRQGSLPWKDYLASRQIQDVASDLSDVIFLGESAPSARLTPQDGVFAKPAIFNASHSQTLSLATQRRRTTILLGVTSGGERPVEKGRFPLSTCDEPEPLAQAA